MNILITTEPDDTHALLVKLALESQSHQVTLLFTADHPTRQTNTIVFDAAGYDWKSSDDCGLHVADDFDVVWWRRPRKPHIPKTQAHPRDYAFMVRENRLFFDSLTDNFAPNAWWINCKQAATRATSKLTQLNLAQQSGMLIPKTLCSNDPDDIRAFMRENQRHGVIYKPLCANFWFDDQQVRVTYTAKVDLALLTSNWQLQMTPGIYQKEVKKRYELRIICFGDYLIAAKINSQNHAAGKIDWRAIPEASLQVEPYNLPSKLEKQIRRFMKQLGLVFGSMDFIVDEAGNYLFLEVNEQGQFLWVEQYLPEIKMLDIFVQFLLQRSTTFAWNPTRADFAIHQYERELAAHLSENLKHHVCLNHAGAYNALG